MKNAFYFQHINTIGGVETFFYELVKKYSERFEIVIYYRTGDQKQINRLKRYCRVVKLEKGEVIECDKAFFNYQLNIEQFKAREYYQILHADYKQQRIIPHTDPRLDGYIGVSQTVCDSFKELTGIEAIPCYNPISRESTVKPLFLLSATRLTQEKGGERMKKLAEKLDSINFPYYWMIFTNSERTIKSPNVIYRESTLDIRRWIAACDVYIQLSDSEGWCYSVNEKLVSGHGHLLTTPCPSFKEMGLVRNITLEFDMSNLNEVLCELNQLLTEPSRDFDYDPKEDIWDRLLEPGGKSQGEKFVIVKATDLFAKNRVWCEEAGKNRIPMKGAVFEATESRAEYLKNLGYVSIIK